MFGYSPHSVMIIISGRHSATAKEQSILPRGENLAREQWINPGKGYSKTHEFFDAILLHI